MGDPWAAISLIPKNYCQYQDAVNSLERAAKNGVSTGRMEELVQKHWCDAPALDQALRNEEDDD